MKVIVKEPVTSVMCARVQKFGSSPTFKCGVDYQGGLLTATSPITWERGFANLANNIVRYDPNLREEEIEAIIFQDDSDFMCWHDGDDEEPWYDHEKHEELKQEVTPFLEKLLKDCIIDRK